MTKREDAQDAFAKVYALVRDGRFRDAEEKARAAVDLYALIPDPVLKDSPICVACDGSAEVWNPDDVVRKTRCEDMPRVCHGNRYGRMAPDQLIAYCVWRVEELAQRQVASVAVADPSSDPDPTPVPVSEPPADPPPSVEEPQPTPAPESP